MMITSISKNKFTYVVLAILVVLPTFYYGYNIYIKNKEINSFEEMELNDKINEIDRVMLELSNDENKIDKITSKKQEIVLQEFESLEFQNQRKIINKIMAEDVHGRREPTPQHAKLTEIALQHIENKTLNEQMEWVMDNPFSIGYFDKMILDKVAKNVTFAMEAGDESLKWDTLTKYIEVISRR